MSPYLCRGIAMRDGRMKVVTLTYLEGDTGPNKHTSPGEWFTRKCVELGFEEPELVEWEWI